jgi:ribosomal-protein-alanine N-acetyltransferase
MSGMFYRGVTDDAGVDAMTKTTTSTWQQKLPILSGIGISLRELRASDAPTLFALLTSDEVTRFISPPPVSLTGFERFVTWAQRQREAGCYACFAVTLQGFDTAIGLFQVRKIDGDPDTAEWGFAIGSPFWGSGVFQHGAELVMDFAFNVMKVNRLEARAAIVNGRGIGALQKIGAVEEGILRKAFLCNGVYLDQALYAVVRDEWTARRSVPRSSQPSVH